ncbi:hypothetical protein JL722_218 [Aureococcus anophagefferens]|nr:hypothetical protein JL722_218 [Aureococcus anophagefferens]
MNAATSKMGTVSGDSHFLEEQMNPTRIKQYLDSTRDYDKAKGMKRDASDFFSDVVKNVVAKSVEVKKMVYMYLSHYCDANHAPRDGAAVDQLVPEGFGRVEPARLSEVCPDNWALLHRSYRKLCHLLADVDEWAQIIILETLARYIRTQFVDPAPGAADAAKALAQQRSAAGAQAAPRKVKRRTVKKAFYSDEEDESQEEEVDVEESGFGGFAAPRDPELPPSSGLMTKEGPGESEGHLDPDHRLALRSSLPLLKSRNSGVIQYVVLKSIATMAAERPSMFAPFLNDFFVKGTDATYVKSNDRSFVCDAIAATGRVADAQPAVADDVVGGLLALIAAYNKDPKPSDAAVVSVAVVPEGRGYAFAAEKTTEGLDVAKPSANAAASAADAGATARTPSGSWASEGAGAVLAAKKPPLTLTGPVALDGLPNFVVGSLSIMVGHEVDGYQDLPDWPDVPPDPATRDPATRAPDDPRDLTDGGPISTQGISSEDAPFYAKEGSDDDDDDDSDDSDSDDDDDDSDSDDDDDSDSDDDDDESPSPRTSPPPRAKAAAPTDDPFGVFGAPPAAPAPAAQDLNQSILNMF